jgi:hypothetical protein
LICLFVLFVYCLPFLQSLDCPSLVLKMTMEEIASDARLTDLLTPGKFKALDRLLSQKLSQNPNLRVLILAVSDFFSSIISQ